nr:DNA (cytosine-5-)-methyltransferase [Mycoplasmopsis bovis]
MYKVCSLFAGVGGIDLGFEQTGKFKTIWANEFDKNALLTYKSNFSTFVSDVDIRKVNVNDIPDVDIILSGFPCTSFSIAGYRKGFEDEKSGDLFFETLRVIVSKQPKAFLLENVKNLVGHDNGKTFKIIKQSLEANGYFIKFAILNAKDYGDIPQNRERIYIVGFKDKHSHDAFSFPLPVKLRTSINDCLEVNVDDDSFYYSADKNVFYSKNLLIEIKNYIILSIMWRRKYVRENKNGVCPTLTANMANTAGITCDFNFD